MSAAIKIFVNEDITGDAVAILLEGAELVEVDGELFPMIECAPFEAMKVVNAINDCITEIVKRRTK